MNIRTISRQSGGADIKLKNKLPKSVAVIVVLAAGMCISLFLYYLIDVVFNGFFVDWFTDRFIQTWDSYDPVTGTTVIRTEPIWHKLKYLILGVFIFTILLLVLTASITSFVYARLQVRKSITKTRTLLHEFMRTETDACDLFPPEYAEISAQMTELKSAMQKNEQILKEETSRKNDLITYLAHDLKTPLTSVIGYLSLLEEARDMPDEQKAKYVQITLDKAMRLEKLINEFFEITRYNLQQIVLEKESVNLNFMLVQMTDEFYPILSAHGNTLRLKLGREKGKDSESVPAEDITVYADAEKLARVFNNILKNAIAYSYPDTEIRVSCRAVEDKAYIAFANKGKTIPVQKLDAVFEKFFRLDDARSTNNGGAGLGLAIAKEIVTLHGGTVSARSRNEVTCFTVALPLQTREEGEP